MESDGNKRLALVEKAIKLNPLSLKIMINYSQALALVGRQDEAINVLFRIIDIDSSFGLAYLNIGNYFRNTKQGEAAYYRYKAYTINPSFNNKNNFESSLLTLDFPERAKEISFGAEIDRISEYYRNKQFDLYVSEGRKTFPRFDSDVTGNWERGMIELYVGNYKEVIHYLKKTPWTNDDFLIFSYLQIGDNDTASLLLEERKKNVATNLNSDNIPHSDLIDLIVEEMRIALLEDNFDLAIQHLKKAMDKGYILGSINSLNKIFTKIQQHPEWSEILEESNKRVVLQQKIYLKMLAEDEKNNL